MSAEAQPISPARFALAIQDLPVENLYSKAREISNSIAHLERSNKQLQEYSDSIRGDSTIPDGTREEGDRECLEAIKENEVVIERQKERIELLKREVESRGGKWHEVNGGGEKTRVNGAQETNGHVEDSSEAVQNGSRVSNSGGGLTDEELQRRMMERMAEQDDDDGDGIHL